MGRRSRKGGHPSAAPRRRRGLLALLVAVLPLLVSLGFPTHSDPLAPVSAQGGGVTVINVPPQFSGFSIRTQDGLNYIDVVVSDYNSWADIFRVRVEVLDNLQAAVADVAFQQYPDNVTLTRQPQFTEPLGSYLVRALSSATYNTQPLTVADRTEMRVTFVLSPVKGTWLSVIATDLGGLEAFAEIEYSPGFFGGLPWVPAIFVAAFAIVGAVVMVGVRVRRDRRGE